MKRIKISGGYTAMVDDEDFKYLCRFAWYHVPARSGTYAYRPIYKDGERTSLPMHREIMGLLPGDYRQVDHINHNRLDNRRSNLRVVSNEENCCNRQLRKDSGTKLKGVGWHKRVKKYQVRVFKSGKVRYAAYFSDPHEAYEAYCREAKKIHGEFARFA